MIQIVIIIAVIFILFTVIGKLFEIIKDIISFIFPIALFLTAVVFIGSLIITALPKIVAVIKGLMPKIVTVIKGFITKIAVVGKGLIGIAPLILCAVCILLIILFISKKIKYIFKRNELNTYGILKVNGSDSILYKLVDNDLAEKTGNYIISKSFYEVITSKISDESELTKNNFEKYCRECLNQFNIEYSGILLNFLQEKNFLISFLLPNGSIYYMTQSFLDKCENLFKKKGGATKGQFEAACIEANILNRVQPNRKLVIDFVINHMFSKGIIKEAAKLENCNLLGNVLYIAAEPAVDCEMTRKNIDLDDL